MDQQEIQEQYEQLKMLISSGHEDSIDLAFGIAEGLKIDLMEWFVEEYKEVIELLPYENVLFFDKESLLAFVRRDKLILDAELYPEHNIFQLPKGLTVFQKLESLSLKNMNIRELPDFIGNFHRLKSIKINSCHHLQKISENVFSNPDLLEFEIKECNEFKQLPVPKTRSNLKEFQVIDCPILFIPDAYLIVFKDTNFIINRTIMSASSPLTYCSQKMQNALKINVKKKPRASTIYFYNQFNSFLKVSDNVKAQVLKDVSQLALIYSKFE